MKKLLLLAPLLLLGSSLQAQTNTPPSLWDGAKYILESIGSSMPTNLSITTFGVYAKDAPTGGDRWGAGTFLLWNVSQNIGAGMGLEAIGGKFFMPSADVTLKVPIHPLGFLGFSNFTVTPFVLAGVATPLGGTEASSVAAITGAGIDTHIARFLGGQISATVGDNYWTGAGKYSGQHLFIGPTWRKGF